jgi:hypothetical protein
LLCRGWANRLSILAP